ncbi:hypothetical protein [Methylobacterium sp. ID0610]|uniref:hypothetical protein n=1 Tax=Methylobacterium carpenticola TaxID=3344827 RepID=UPI0036BF60C9
MRILIGKALRATAALGLAVLPDLALAQQPTPASPAGLAQPAPGVPGHRQPRPDALAKPDAKPEAKSEAGKLPSPDEATRKAAARDKAWDSRMKRTLGSICKGC